MVARTLATARDQGIVLLEVDYRSPITAQLFGEHQSCFSGSGWPQLWRHGGRENERRNLASGNISNGSARSRSLFCVHQCLRENLGDAHDLFYSLGRGLRVRISTHGNDTA